MFSVRFCAIARAVALLLLALVALDLGNPSLCALDQAAPLMPVSAATLDQRPTDDSGPAGPVHIDDCFCCSHCVDVSSIAAPSPLAWAASDLPLPRDRAPFTTASPLYHPPRG